MSAHLLVLTKFLQLLTCSDSLLCSGSIIYTLETKIDAGNNVSHMAKLGNIGETLRLYEDCEYFWKNASLFF